MGTLAAAPLLITEAVPKEESKALPLGRVGKYHVLLCANATVVYFLLLLFATPGETWLWLVLLATQLFRVWQVLVYCCTVWPRAEIIMAQQPLQTPEVDIMITTVGEDLTVLEETIRAAVNQDYAHSRVYVLNDAFVRGNRLWKDVEQLAFRYGARCITRTVPGGGKAGNINQALPQTTSPFIAILDADHVPHANFLSSLITPFVDEDLAVVQSPQYYCNFDLDPVSRAAWAQQRIFFSAVLQGKDAVNAGFMCGTNMVVRRAALIEVGGFDESCIAEDFATSILLHANGWRTRYVPTVLAEGLAPEDLFSYCRQQSRWARGSLGAAVKYSVWSRSGLSAIQRLHYLASAGYYLSGVVTSVELLFPLLAFFSGATPLAKAEPALLVALLLSLAGSASLVWKSTAGALSPSLVSFAISGFTVHVQAAISTVLQLKTNFNVTSKKRVEGNFLRFALPHLLYILLVGMGSNIAFRREGFSSTFFANLLLAALSIACFAPFIAASFDAKFGAQKPVSAL